MRYGWMIGAAMLAAPALAQGESAAPDGLDREECIELLGLSESLKAQALDLTLQAQAQLLQDHGPIAVETDPTQPLVDATAAAWMAFGLSLGELCRDKL